MKHIIYLTTCLITGKQYVGRHKIGVEIPEGWNKRMIFKVTQSKIKPTNKKLQNIDSLIKITK